MNRNIIYFVLAVLGLIGTSFASPVIVSNSNSIAPNSVYEFLTNNFFVNVTDTVAVNSLVWSFNGVVVYTQNGVTDHSGIFNYTAPPYNAVANILVSVNIIDSGGNGIVSTRNVIYKQYILPSVATILPLVVQANSLSTFNAQLTPGSFPLNDVIWNFQTHYYTNIAYNGTNYQAYTFPVAGTYSVVAQACDINAFCSSASQSVHAASSVPNSYWTISSATVFGGRIGNTILGIPSVGLQAPSRGQITALFRPQNDSNPISTVTFNWGDSSALQQTTYNSGVTTDTFYHNYVNFGNYSVSATVCDTIGNCNTTSIVQYVYQQTFAGSLSSVILNSNPNIPTSTFLSQLLSGLNTFGSNLVGALIEFAVVVALLIFGVIFALGYAKKRKII